MVILEYGFGSFGKLRIARHATEDGQGGGVYAEGRGDDPDGEGESGNS